MRKITFHGLDFSVDPILDDYKIETRSSTNVHFFGDNGTSVFVQFKNGKSYLYQNVSKEHIEAIYNAESIGRFIPVLSKAYTYVPVDKELVKPLPAEAIATKDC